MTTLSELIEILQDYERTLHHDPEVRLAIQPESPMEHYLEGAALVRGDRGLVVYLGDGGQIGYLSDEDALDELGWLDP